MYRASIVFVATCLVLSVTASVAAQSPKPPPYPTGAGVIFEPAGPSVWRAVEPEWDCDAAYPRRPFHDGAEVAPDGSIWFLDHQRGIRELGSCPIVEPKLTFGTRDQALGPDGTLWVLNDDRLWSWDGTDWLVHLEGFNQPGRVGDTDGGGYSYSTVCEAGTCYFFVDVAPDGRVWLSGTTVSAYDGAEWTDYMDDPLFKIVVGFGPDGSAWVQGGEGGGDIFVIQPSGEPPVSGSASEATVPPPAVTAESTIAGSFPASIGGRPVEVTTWSGPEWLARYDLEAPGAGAAMGIEATEALLTAAGTTLDELTIATAIVEPSPGNVATIAAVHIPGSKAYDLIDPVIDLMAGATEPLVSWRLMAQRWVALVTENATPGSYPVKVYPAGDTAWIIQADRAIAESIVADLPSQPTLAEPTAVTSTVARSPSASQKAVSQSVEIPEAGIFVTFPADWRIWSTQSPEGETFFVASNGSLRQTCRIFLMEEFVTPEAAADRHGTPHPDIEILEREAIELPVGDALRVSWRHEKATSWFDDYYVAVPGSVVSVSCIGGEPPADPWIPIVESIGTLPASAPSPATFDPRVEIPDHGFAVDFPAEWLVTTGPSWPGGLFGGEFVLRAQTVTRDGEPASAECWIEDDVESPGQLEVESIEGFLEALTHQLGERRLTAVPIVTQAELPSGRSGRVEWHWKRKGELPTAAWVFSDGDSRLLFMCRSERPPEDRWLSIAETFEFLPGE